METDKERLERVLVIAENSESYDAILLAAEVRRLRRGIQAVRDECAKIEATYRDTPRDPSLSWYEFDRRQEDLSLQDDVQQDIITALNEALGEGSN